MQFDLDECRAVMAIAAAIEGDAVHPDGLRRGPGMILDRADELKPLLQALDGDDSDDDTEDTEGGPDPDGDGGATIDRLLESAGIIT